MPIIKPITKDITRDVVSSITNTDVSLEFFAPLTSSLNLSAGEEVPTHIKTTVATITDHEDIVRDTIIGEARHLGGRRIEDLSTGLVTEANIPVISGNEYQVTIQGGSGDTAVCSDAFSGTLTADGSNRISWNNGTPKTASTATLDITVTGTLTELLVEDVTGQSVQTPSEQITGSVVYKEYENASTVSAGGAVTTIAGASITTDGYLEEQLRDNYTDTDDDLTGGAEIITLDASGTGEHALSVSGTAAVTVAAVTASGTGFGQATAGNDVEFIIIGPGTVSLTLDSGSLSTSQAGHYIKQVEKGQESTSFIPSPGGGATRGKDVLTYNYTPNPLVGSMLVEIKLLSKPSSLGLTIYGIAMSSDSRFIYLIDSPDRLSTYDGGLAVNYSAWPAYGSTLKFGLTWEAGGSPERALYLNGVQVATSTLDADGYDGGGQPLYIGGISGQAPINGAYKNVKFYNVAKDQAFMEAATT